MYKQLKTNDGYVCKICNTRHNTMHWLKQHLFLEHNDIEGVKYYDRIIQKIVGTSLMQRFRTQLITKFVSGQLEQHFKDSLSIIDVESHRCNRSIYTILMDPNETSKQRRIALYNKKRELLLKLIPDVTAGGGEIDAC